MKRKLLKATTRKLVNTSKDLGQIALRLKEVETDIRWILGISIFAAVILTATIVTWLIKFILTK